MSGSFSDLCARRHSVRSYDPTRKVDRSLLERIMAAAQSGPTAGNLQAWCAHVVDLSKLSEADKRRLYGAEWFQSVPVMIIFTALRRESSKKYKQRGRELYAVQDATIAASLSMMEATALGLGTCWLGAFSDRVAVELLGLSTERDEESGLRHEDPIALITVGYEKILPDAIVDPIPKKKARKRPDDVRWVM